MLSGIVKLIGLAMVTPMGRLHDPHHEYFILGGIDAHVLDRVSLVAVALLRHVVFGLQIALLTRRLGRSPHTVELGVTCLRRAPLSPAIIESTLDLILDHVPDLLVDQGV